MDSPKNKGTSGSRYILSLRKVRSQKSIWVAGHTQSTFKGLISVLSSANAPGFPPHKIKKPDLCSNVAFALHPNTKHHQEKKKNEGWESYMSIKIWIPIPTVPAESKMKLWDLSLVENHDVAWWFLSMEVRHSRWFSAEPVKAQPPYLLLGQSLMKRLWRGCFRPWMRVPVRQNYFDL